MGAPYAFGEAMLTVAAKRGGTSSLDDFFVRPPTTDEHLVDPWTFLEDDDLPLGVEQPKLRSGEKQTGEGTFGELTWLFMLAERRPALRDARRRPTAGVATRTSRSTATASTACG